MQQGEKAAKEKACPFCNTIFTQKTLCDSHLLEIYQGECANYSLLESVTNDEQNMLPSFVPLDDTGVIEVFSKKLNSSVLSNDGEIIDVNLSILERKTRIHAIFETTPICQLIPFSKNNLQTKKPDVSTPVM